MHTPPVSRQSGFSLIELMVVLFILGLLAAWVGPRLIGQTDDAKFVKAKIDIAALESALKIYKIDNGFFPTTEQGLQALIQAPETAPIPTKWRPGGYMDKNRIPKDPWGREYLYLSPGSHGDFDIMSYGGDGVPGGDENDRDVNSWEME